MKYLLFLIYTYTLHSVQDYILILSSFYEQPLSKGPTRMKKGPTREQKVVFSDFVQSLLYVTGEK